MDPLAELMGESAAIEAVREQIRRLVARRETGRRLPSVLLQGETGSGKGLVARMLHRVGPRARAPFVDLNCAAMPEHLVESELFGYERGAFTDARRSKPGLFLTAHRGVIFLDEIGELTESTQAKLLKVLEEGVVRRLGATGTEPADVSAPAPRARTGRHSSRRALPQPGVHGIRTVSQEAHPGGRGTHLALPVAGQCTGARQSDGARGPPCRGRQCDGKHARAAGIARGAEGSSGPGPGLRLPRRGDA